MKKTVLWSLVLGMFVAAPASVFASEGGSAEKFAGLSKGCSDALRSEKADKSGDACTEALNALKDAEGPCKYKKAKGKKKGKGSTPEKYAEDFTAAVGKVCAASEASAEGKSAESESAAADKSGDSASSGADADAKPKKAKKSKKSADDEK